MPTGAGKTHLIAEIGNVFGLKTIVLSPTQQILKQTEEVSGKIAPDVKVTNFYANEKDLSGDIINTTYQSFSALVAAGLKPEDVGLILADESDMGLGEKRHTLYKNFPDALKIGLTAIPYFSPLSAYEQRGLVDRNDEWTKMFQNCIHEMTIEEAVEREIIPPLDIHLLKTHTVVPDVPITPDGDYDRTKLAQYVNIFTRNSLAVGMISGADNLLKDINIPARQRQEIARIHDKIKGKRTVVFGLTIDHVESISESLKKAGIRAEAVHSKISEERRKEILDAYKRGEVQVVVGVDMLVRGWDSPETEVELDLAPTVSGIVAVQRLGRLFRHSPGKTKGIAIQLIDDFTRKTQKPILFPSIFDPYAVLRGTQTGKERGQSTANGQTPKPVITLYADTQTTALLEEYKTQELFQNRLKHTTVMEMKNIIDGVVLQVLEENQGVSAYDTYRLIAQELPGRISRQAQDTILQAVASIDSNTAAIGRQLVALVNLKTILACVEPYMGKDADYNDELVQEAFTSVLERTSAFTKATPITAQIHQTARHAAASFIAKAENIPVDWVLNFKYKDVLKGADAIFNNYSYGFTEAQAEEFAESLAKRVGVNAKTLEAYLKGRRAETPAPFENGEEEIVDEVARRILRDDIEKLLDKAFPEYVAGEHTRRTILEKRFGLKGEEKTFKEVGQDLGVAIARVRQLETMALRTLRTFSHNGELRKYMLIQQEASNEPTQLPELKFEDEKSKKVSASTLLREITYDYEALGILKNYNIGFLYQFIAFAPRITPRTTDMSRETIANMLRAAIFRMIDDKTIKYLSIYGNSNGSNPSDSFLRAVTDTIFDSEGREALRGLYKTERIVMEKLWKSFDPTNYSSEDIQRLQYITEKRTAELEREARIKIFNRQINKIIIQVKRVFRRNAFE